MAAYEKQASWGQNLTQELSLGCSFSVFFSPFVTDCLWVVPLDYLIIKMKWLSVKLNEYPSSKPLSAHDEISAKHFSQCQKALRRQPNHGERTGPVWKGRAQLPLEKGSTTSLHSIMFALAGRTPKMMLFGDWAQQTADACRLLYGKSRHPYYC